MKVPWMGVAALGVVASGTLYAAGGLPGHMLAHLLLSLLVPPALLAARPRWRLRVPAALGFGTLAAVTVASHLPHVMMTVHAYPALLAVEGALFLGAGLLFAHAVRRADAAALTILVAQMAVCALTGAWVAYGGRQPGSAAAGTLMWVGGGLLYAAAALGVVARLVGREDAGESKNPEVGHVA